MCVRVFVDAFIFARIPVFGFVFTCPKVFAPAYVCTCACTYVLVLSACVCTRGLVCAGPSLLRGDGPACGIWQRGSGKTHTWLRGVVKREGQGWVAGGCRANLALAHTHTAIQSHHGNHGQADRQTG
jgi:hypothetical protein